MTPQQTIVALTKCANAEDKLHECTGCPLSHERSCHKKLCESAIEVIMHERSIGERYAHELNSLRNQLSNMYIK